MRTTYSRRRNVSATMVGALSLSMLVAGPAIAQAQADMAEGTVLMDSDGAGITAQGQTQANLGGQYRIAGTKWCYGDKKTGQWIGVKLIDGADPDSGKTVIMNDAHQAVTLPDGGTQDLGQRGVFAMLKANDDPTGTGNCTLDATVTLPDATNSDLDVASFSPGSKKALALLAGSFGPKTGGSAPHSATVSLTISEPAAPAPEVASTRTAKMTAERHQGIPGQYQGAYSTKTGKFYITGVQRASAKEGVVTDGASTIAEYDPKTQKILRAAVLPSIPATESKMIDNPTGLSVQVMPHGIAIDDARNVIWVTDTRQDYVSAYDLTTFKPLWRSADKQIPHGRDIMVRANGDVIIGGDGGAWKLSGNASDPKVEVFHSFGATDFTAPLGMADLGNEVVINNYNDNTIRFLDANTGKLNRSFDLVGPSTTPDLRHGGLGVDRELGVLVSADQGVRDANKNFSGAGVGFYKLDGTSLGYLPVGGQNLTVMIDETEHIAYVGDFGNGDVNVFDLKSAAEGKPAHIGRIEVMGNSKKGVNHIVRGGGYTLVVGKDAGYTGVTVPYGLDSKTGATEPFTGDADSLALLHTTMVNSVFNPATDATVSTMVDGYDLSKLPLSPAKDTPSTPPSTPKPSGGSLDSIMGDSGSLSGALAGSAAGFLSPILMVLLGLGGFAGGVLAGMFTPIGNMFAPLLGMFGHR